MDIDMNGLSKISSHIIHVMTYMPNQLVLFSETEGVRLWQTDTHHFQKTNVFTLQDTQIKSSTNVKTLNCAFVDFFKLAHHQGIFLAKQDGSVYWRSLQNDSKLEETWLLSMEPQEQILWIEYDSDQLVVIGNQGTVVSYFSRHDTGLHHQTFRIHGTIRALSKMSASIEKEERF
ncbi:hypothetical protein BD560DRAFT_171645 [Blakeslea trispora]|nr:hypothetical protein BD560DRAFT_171645 [Blakeslea trispora]